LGRASYFPAQRAPLVGVLSRPTRHGVSHAPRRRASGRYSAQGLFARFAPPKPNARPTTPRRGESHRRVDRTAHPALESSWQTSRAPAGVCHDGVVRVCREPRSVTEGGVKEEDTSGAPPDGGGCSRGTAKCGKVLRGCSSACSSTCKGKLQSKSQTNKLPQRRQCGPRHSAEA